MAQTFEEGWRRARLRFPGVPALLVRDWVQDAYTELCEYRQGGWGFLRSQGFLSTRASRTVAITVVQGSTTVTSAAGFLATDVGQQLKVGNFPVYTITVFTDTSTVTIDQAYAGDGVTAGAATIFTGYLTCPADFGRFLYIIDTYNQRPVSFWLSEDTIAATDPSRQVSLTGVPTFVPFDTSPVPSTLGQVRYEIYGGSSDARQYPFLYYKKAQRFADTDPLPGVVSNRADLLTLGAELHAARWPGTAEQKNPYYNLGLAGLLQREWDKKVQDLSLTDDNQFPEDHMLVHWMRRMGGLAEPTTLLRSTDADLSAYI